MLKLGFYLSSIAVTRSFSSLPPCSSSSSDAAELSGKRLQTLLALNSVYASFGASDVFSLDSFLSELGPLVTPEFSTTVPYGGGTYAGLNDAAEYLSLQFSSVNVGGSSFNLSDTGGVLPGVSTDGDAYTTKTNFAANFFPTVNPSLRLPIQSEVVITFAPCRSRSILPPTTIHMLPAWYSITIDLFIDLCSDPCNSIACHTRSEKIALYRNVPNPSLGDWIRAISWSAIHSTYQGVFDVWVRVPREVLHRRLPAVR